LARFLMTPHAPGGLLAHLAACLAVADGLRERGHEAIFAYGGTLPALIERAGFEWRPVIEARGPMHWEWFHDADELDSMISSHLALIEELRPAACVASAGLSRLATEVAGIPHMALLHSLAGTRYGAPKIRGWMLRDAARHPTRLLGHLSSRRSRRQGSEIAASIAEVRRRRGLPALSAPSNLMAGADLVACATAPFLDPARPLPAHYHYAGPLDYGAAAATAIPCPGRAPRAYVSQGSTGSAKHLRRAAAELAAEGLEVVVTTGGLCDPAELQELGPNVIATAIADTRAELEAADLAVIAGGNMTAMQALVMGTPTVVLPRSSQQATGALRAQRLGTGVALWPFARRGSIARAARRILRDPSFARRSAELATRLAAGWSGNRRVAELAERLAAPEAAGGSSPGG